MSLEIVNTAAQTVAKLINLMKVSGTYTTTNSLAEVSKLTRVEPLTILSKDLLNLDYMPDVQQTLLNLFCAYYLQAVNIMTKVHHVEVIRLLDRLNPNRDSTGFLLSESAKLDTESFKHSLPMSNVRSLSMEADVPKNALNEISNLAVGKLLNVSVAFNSSSDAQVGADGKPGKDSSKIDLQIAVRLMASVIPDATIQHLLSFKSEDNSLEERYHAWRSGRISFISDLIFAQDLIDEWRKASMGDNTDTMQEIIRRVNNSKKMGILTRNPSLVSASNIFVISEETARSVESKLGGKLSNPRVRQKAFDNTYAMIIAVVDREYERVTFYTRGLNASTDVSIREIKSSGSKGPDIGDLLKAMTLGSPMHI